MNIYPNIISLAGNIMKKQCYLSFCLVDDLYVDATCAYRECEGMES